MSNSSATFRFAFSLLSSFLRGVITFLTGLVIARGLGPKNYGDFVFLLGSFLAIRQLLDMGTSSAFFTFLSQKPRGQMFLISYALWQLAQFLLALFVIGLLLPDSWLEEIWVGQNKGLIVLAFTAVFLREQAWNTLVQIGESLRLTHKAQGLNLSIALFHFLLVMILWEWNILSIQWVLVLIILEYVAAHVVGIKILVVDRFGSEPFDGSTVWAEYVQYCIPLIVYVGCGFSREFADRWLLQRYGGSIEQGFYGVGYQFATVSILVTSSLVKIFWKEIAEAHEVANLVRIQRLYQKACRFLYVAGAAIGGFFIPWSEDIIRQLLGPSYLEGTLVLSIMLLYPIHQALGQITGTLLLATAKTKTQVALGTFFLVLGIPVSYFIQAPHDALFPGLELGSKGMAFKMVAFQIVSVNFTIWWISREFKWKFDWVYQVIGLGGALLSGWLAYQAVMLVTADIDLHLFFKMGLSFLLFSGMISIFIWSTPWVAGFTREEIRNHILTLREAFSSKA